MNPRPSEEVILRAYTAASSGEDLSFAHHYASSESVESNYSWTGAYVLDCFIKHRPGGSFLDIGAGQGWAVLEALKRGADAYGYEFGDDRAFERDERLRSRIFRAENQIERSGKKFDMLFLSAVLEHVYKPVDFLESWMRFLSDDGLFCVAGVPNMESIFIRLNLDGWDGNLPPGHLSYFDPASLKDAVRRAGGEIVDFFTMGAPNSVSVSNIWNQNRFAEPAGKGNTSSAEIVRKAREQSVHAGASRLHGSFVAAMNHLLSLMGMGSNLYVVFRKKTAGR